MREMFELGGEAGWPDTIVAQNLPVGIVGQSLSTTQPRNGKRDDPPLGKSAGHFKTSVMAEGAVEGGPHTPPGVSRYDVPPPLPAFLPHVASAVVAVRDAVRLLAIRRPRAALARRRGGGACKGRGRLSNGGGGPQRGLA